MQEHRYDVVIVGAVAQACVRQSKLAPVPARPY